VADVTYADETVVRAAQLMTPDLANFVGNVHGGHVVFLADNLAFAYATRYAGTGCTSAALDRVDFYEPVHIGELLHPTARVCYTGHATMEVDVDVHAEEMASGAMRLTNTCHFTFVALRDGKAAPVLRLVPRTREGKARYLRAKERRDLGIQYREARQGAAARYDELEEDALDALIAQDQEQPPTTTS
jgi:acyl-CoA hydrolase